MSYVEIKGNIKARLYGETKAKEIKNSGCIYCDAEPWGFEGLYLIPVIELGYDYDNSGFKVSYISEELVDEWGVTESEIIETSIQNLDYKVKSLRQTVINIMGLRDAPKEIIDLCVPPMPTNIYVITNKTGVCGASSIIPATKELIKMFPNGYVVLPSSIHEVIVVEKTDDEDTDTMNDMVREINSTVVQEKDKLSDDIYEFVA